MTEETENTIENATETENIYEITDATFMSNEAGRVTVMLPALEGEPKNPKFELTDHNSLFFYRTPETACVLSNLSDETVKLLQKTSKCLLIELDLDNVVSTMDADEERMEEAFQRVYEVNVTKGQ